MILPVRQRHRMAFVVLALSVPLVFATAIVSRQTPATPSPTSNVLFSSPRYETVIWERADFWENHRIGTRLVGDRQGQFAIEVSETDDLLRPDLLLYWTAADSKVTGVLPENAIFLGSVQPEAPIAIKLPSDSGAWPGKLILYSLADHEIIAVSRELGAKVANH